MADHYYSKNQKSELRIKEIEANIIGYNFKFLTGSGVFGKKKIDKGTLLLIENCSLGENKGQVLDVLDLGCGYGVVGIVVKKLFPHLVVTCSDVNKRALMLTKKNADKNDVDIKFVDSDIFSKIDEKFDTILINLPQNAGKEICFKMIEGSYDHLKKEGSLQVVSRHQKGGKQYEKKINEIFGNCDYLAKGSGYRVYIGIKTLK